MKKILLSSVICLWSFHLFAQNLPEQDCSGAIPVCQFLYQQANSYVGHGLTQELNTSNRDCLLSDETNSVWYIINVSTSGLLEFTITPNIPTDYDFAIWNATGQGCSAVANSLPVRCNYAGSTPPTGISSTITNAWFEPAINAVAGETYILVVDNFMLGTTGGYSLDFSTSTASIFDTLPPHFTAAHTKCDLESDSLTVTMSEPIQCSSLAADGSDFYITPNVAGLNIASAYSDNCVTGLFTNEFKLHFSNSIPAGTYWLHAKVGVDANTVLDNCGNPQSTEDSIEFIVNPSALYMVQLDTPACIKARVIINREIRCSTVAYDGSDFSVSGPSAVEVTSATPVNCDPVSDMTNTIDLTFDQSIIIPGTYTLSVKTGFDGNSILDTCGSSVSNTINWEVSDKGVEAYADPNLICNPGYTTFYATTGLAPSAEGYQLLWTPGTFLDDSTKNITLGYVPHSTVYNVQIIDDNYCYRRDTANVTVSIRTSALAAIRDTQLCIGQSIQFNASGGVNYFWYPSTGLDCIQCPNPVAAPETTTEYAVVISDQYDCSDTIKQTLVVHPLPIINASDDTTIFFGEMVQLYTNVNTPSVFSWKPPTGLDNPNAFNPKAMPEQTTTYVVTAVDVNNCTNTDSVTVTVRTDIPVNIPTAFTPNGDGKNDVFHLSNPKFERLQEFRVFNRWGKEVFSTNDVKQGWDGSFQGVPQDMGVYNYVIKVSFPDGRVEVYKGNVSLVR